MPTVQRIDSVMYLVRGFGKVCACSFVRLVGKKAIRTVEVWRALL